MATAFQSDFKPFANAGQLIGILPISGEVPSKFFKVISVEPVPTLLATIAASASDERQSTLEVANGVLIQYRYVVAVANAQVVLRSPQAARSYGTGGGGQGFVATTTETDWGTVNDRSPTEFFFLGGQQNEIRFDNLAATEATDTRFSGWKLFLSSSEVNIWSMKDAENTSRVVDVDPHGIPDRAIHLLENFAGIVPQFLTRN